MKLTIDSKVKGGYLVVEKGKFGSKRYTEKHFFDDPFEAKQFYDSQPFMATGEWNSPDQIKSLHLYKKQGNLGKVLFWQPLESRVNKSFTQNIYDASFEGM